MHHLCLTNRLLLLDQLCGGVTLLQISLAYDEWDIGEEHVVEEEREESAEL